MSISQVTDGSVHGLNWDAGVGRAWWL